MTKRSSQIEIAFVSAVAAAALSGCNADAAYHRDWQQCVNQANVVVDDRFCDQRPQGAVSSGGGGGYYHWWYSPRPYGMGSYISGGYSAPLNPSSVARASGGSVLGGSSGAGSTVRGGFGSSAHVGGGS